LSFGPHKLPAEAHDIASSRHTQVVEHKIRPVGGDSRERRGILGVLRGQAGEASWTD
jgi:hypothetical protein